MLAVGGRKPAVAAGVWESASFLLDAESLKEHATLAGHGDLVRSVAFDRQGKWLATGSLDKTIHLRDPKTGKTQATLAGHHLPVMGVAFVPDGKFLFSCSGGMDSTGKHEIGGLKLWDLSTKSERLTMKAHQATCLDIVCSTNNKRAFSCSADQTWKVWDVSTGQELFSLSGHTGPIRCLACTLNGELIATGGDDGAVRLWNGTVPLAIRELHEVTQPATPPEK